MDLEEGSISIRQAVTGAGKHVSVGTPKSGKARVVSITPETTDRLRRHRLEVLERRLATGSAWDDKAYVFIGRRHGEPVSSRALLYAVTEAAERAGLGKIRFHDLRHAHASALLAMGVHPKIVSERLGHSTIAITMNLDSHLMPNLQKDAIAGLDDLLAAPKFRGQLGGNGPP